MADNSQRFVSERRLQYFAKNLPWQRMRKAMGLGDTLGALPVENGGTGVGNLSDLGKLIDEARTASSTNKIILEAKGNITYSNWSNTSTDLYTEMPFTIKQDPYGIIQKSIATNTKYANGFSAKKGMLCTASYSVTANTTQKWVLTSMPKNSFIVVETGRFGIPLPSSTAPNMNTSFYISPDNDGEDTSWNTAGSTVTRTASTPFLYLFNPDSVTYGAYRPSLAKSSVQPTAGNTTFTIAITLMPLVY